NSRITSASAIDINGKKVVFIRNISLNSDGKYEIVATRVGERQGTTSGNYKLGIEASLGLALLPTEIASYRTELISESQIFDGEVVYGQLPELGQANIWYFEGQRGELVTAVVRGQNGETIDRQFFTLTYFENNEWRAQTNLNNQTDEIRMSNFALP